MNNRIFGSIKCGLKCLRQ